jgi:hypothetical protein
LNHNVNEKPGTPTNADALLEESVAMLAPLVRLLVANGITYPQFTGALKVAFLRAAHAELEAENKKATDSAVSLRSGVHRKDVRALTADGARPSSLADRARSLPDEVFMRWTNDPEYLDADGLPKVLPLRSRTPDELSFDALAQSISSDFHSRSVLEELVRLGLAETRGESVRLRLTSFVPREGVNEALEFMSAAISDHIAAAARNVRAIQGEQAPAFLDQSIYADDLSAESVMELHRLGRRIWESALRRMYALADERLKIDRNNALVDQTMRMRFGTYFYAEPASPVAQSLPMKPTEDEQ